MNKADLFYKPLIKEAWGITKKYYWTILGFLFFIGVTTVLLQLTLNFTIQQRAWLLVVPIYIGLVVYSVLVKFWSKRLFLNLAKGVDTSFKDSFKGFDNFWKYFVTNLICGLIVFAGILLLIFPAFIWGYRYILAPYFALDKGMDLHESLKASADATKDLKMKIFLLSFLVLIIVIISALPLLLGLFATIPLVYVLQGLLYVRLSGNTEEGVVVDNVIAQPVEELNNVPEATVVV